MEKKYSIGKKIKQLRESLDLSVEQLAEQSKTHRKFIEELESDQLVPSIAPLLKIARGLGVQLSTLMDDDPTTGAVVARQTALPETELGFSGLGPYCTSTLEFHPLAKNRKGRNMEPFIIDVYPSVPEECTFSSHEGEEFIYVLEGEIEVLYGGDQYILGVGDSIYYESTTSHQVKTASDKKARILAVINPGKPSA
jgi:mannose-6-phosphate isomerase-like protein (cupin superfamily)